MAMKADCYKCRYRADLPGDAHSRCLYPGTKTGMFDFFAPENLVLGRKLDIQADSYGVKMGWFLWPVNFDPVWLRNCNGFEPADGCRAE
jgi:hypothetical protein